MAIPTKSSFLIAAPRSNSGKTLITLGLMHVFVQRGLKVQPFKIGPDYIDPMHHSKVAGSTSYNLDLWMASKEHVQQVFGVQSQKADVALAEGVMGLFDGAKKDEGSSAAVARLLNLPVVLVVDASSTAYSVAPLLYGFKNFDKSIKLAGVIFNKVAGESHFEFLEEAANDAGVEVLGYIPRDNRLSIESRHLGLHLPNEYKNIEIINIAAELIEKHVEVEKLLSATKSTHVFRKKKTELHKDAALKIALANDDAFNFSYQANKDVLMQMGQLVEFSPIYDMELPECDLVWLPGGYPELFAKQLAQNQAIKKAIIKHVAVGKALVAECGGMMYLGKNISTKDGQKYEMTGVFDFDTSFEDMRLHLGYRELSKEKLTIHGHEFHYSELRSKEMDCAGFEAKTARGKIVDMPVFRTQNCWASYMHLYLGEPCKMQQFLKELGLCNKVK